MITCKRSSHTSLSEVPRWARAYRAMNLGMAGYSLYILLLPFLSPLMERVFPDVWGCSYYRLTGQYCPLCGMTRDFSSMSVLSGGAAINPASLAVLLFIVGSLVYRVWVSFSFLKVTALAQKTLLFLDSTVHAGLLGVLVFETVKNH